MKNLSSRIISAMALAVIILCLLGGFSRLDPEHMAKSLLNRRISILQDALGGQIAKQAAEEQLRQIEDEALLAQDLGILAQLTDQNAKKQNRTKKDSKETALLEKKACLGTIGEIQQKKQYYQYTTYEAKLWPNGHSLQEDGKAAVLCNVVVKKEDRTFFLTVFERENL